MHDIMRLKKVNPQPNSDCDISSKSLPLRRAKPLFESKPESWTELIVSWVFIFLTGLVCGGLITAAFFRGR
jgi:hypothetical protein